MPAGLLAIGNSIVTRAGPSLAITGIEKKDTPQRVYNFTVEEFHSYLVGKSALWTHNVTYGGKSVEPDMRATDEINGLVQNNVYRTNPTAGVLSPQLDNGFIKVSASSNLFVNNQRFTGELMYAVDESGNVIFGLRNVQGWTKPDGSILTAAHPTLIGGIDPKARVAGMVSVRNGKIMTVSRDSGHYKPEQPRLGAARDAFEKHPYIMHEKFDWDNGFVDGF